MGYSVKLKKKHFSVSYKYHIEIYSPSLKVNIFVIFIKEGSKKVNYFCRVLEALNIWNKIAKKKRKKLNHLPKWRPSSATRGLPCSKGRSVLVACSLFNHIFTFWVGLPISGTCFVSLLLILKNHRCMRYVTWKLSMKNASLLKRILAYPL